MLPDRGDDPPCLDVGAAVSAKFKGAFCESKILEVQKKIAVKVAFENGAGNTTVAHTALPENTVLKIGNTTTVEIKKETMKGQIIKMKDQSKYKVRFNDGDEVVVSRRQILLKESHKITTDQNLEADPEALSSPTRKRAKIESASANDGPPGEDDDEIEDVRRPRLPTKTRKQAADEDGNGSMHVIGSEEAFADADEQQMPKRKQKRNTNITRRKEAQRPINKEEEQEAIGRGEEKDANLDANPEALSFPAKKRAKTASTSATKRRKKNDEEKKDGPHGEDDKDVKRPRRRARTKKGAVDEDAGNGSMHERRLKNKAGEKKAIGGEEEKDANPEALPALCRRRFIIDLPGRSREDYEKQINGPFGVGDEAVLRPRLPPKTGEEADNEADRIEEMLRKRAERRRKEEEKREREANGIVEEENGEGNQELTEKQKLRLMFKPAIDARIARHEKMMNKVLLHKSLKYSLTYRSHRKFKRTTMENLNDQKGKKRIPTGSGLKSIPHKTYVRRDKMKLRNVLLFMSWKQLISRATGRRVTYPRQWFRVEDKEKHAILRSYKILRKKSRRGLVKKWLRGHETEKHLQFVLKYNDYYADTRRMVKLTEEQIREKITFQQRCDLAYGDVDWLPLFTNFVKRRDWYPAVLFPDVLPDENGSNYTRRVIRHMVTGELIKVWEQDIVPVNWLPKFTNKELAPILEARPQENRSRFLLSLLFATDYHRKKFHIPLLYSMLKCRRRDLKLRPRKPIDLSRAVPDAVCPP